MYPWYGLSPLTSFLRVANKLAEKGHKIFFFLPTKAQPKLTPHNHWPNLITFFPITIPHVDGLPVGAQTPRDIPNSDWPLLEAAMDLTHDTIDSHLAQLKPDLVFFDFAHWVPSLARKHGAKSVFYATSSLARFAYLSVPCGWAAAAHNVDVDDLEAQVMRPPPGFPCPEMGLQAGEARVLVSRMRQHGGLSLMERFGISLRECDAVGSKTCREMEGQFCDYLENTMGKPVLLAGPLVPEPPSSKLDHHMESWLNGFSEGSVVYCAVGSQYALTKDQLQELLLGLELTHKPFLAVLNPPTECETIELGLPQGFLKRTKGRGIVQSGWMQQSLILQHPSVGCFVTHCGSGSLSEAMVSQCQLVMMPQAADQFINAKLMSKHLEVGVEIDKGDEQSFFTKEAICKAVLTVMDVASGVGKEVRNNHAKWRDLLLEEGFEDSYIDQFILSLQHLLNG